MKEDWISCKESVDFRILASHSPMAMKHLLHYDEYKIVTVYDEGNEIENLVMLQHLHICDRNEHRKMGKIPVMDEDFFGYRIFDSMLWIEGLSEYEGDTIFLLCNSKGWFHIESITFKNSFLEDDDI